MSIREEQIFAEHERIWLEPDPDPVPVEYCDKCGEGIYIGERAWEIDGDVLCDDCAKQLYSKEVDDT